MSQVEELEVSLEYAQGIVAKRDMLDKLSRNREFKQLVLEGYFKDEAIRLTNLSADPHPQVAEHRDDIFLAIQGISLLRQYFQRINREGEIAENEIAEYRTALAHAHAEEDDA